jgi:hypothetical protein
MNVISDDAGMGVRRNGVLDTADGVVLVGTERQVVNAVLEQDLHFPVLLLIVTTQHIKILSQLRHPLPQLVVIASQHGVFPQRRLQVILHLPETNQVFLVYHWLFDVDRILNWHFHWHFHPHWHLHDAFPLRLLNVDWLIDVDWLFDDGGDLYGHCSYNFLFDLLYHLVGHFLLHLNVLWYLNYLLHNTLWPWN